MLSVAVQNPGHSAVPVMKHYSTEERTGVVDLLPAQKGDTPPVTRRKVITPTPHMSEAGLQWRQSSTWAGKLGVTQFSCF